MPRTKWIYDEWRILLDQSHDWTPDNHNVARMRELFALMPAPTISRYTDLRIVERSLDLPPTDPREIMHRFKPHERRHLELLVE